MNINNNTSNIIDIDICKQPLFVTEDGVEVFKNGKYFVVQTEDTFQDWFPWQVQHVDLKSMTTDLGMEQTFSLDLGDNTIKRFSTKRKAKDYILRNKPCLSVQDVMDSNYDGSCSYGPHTLVKIVKEKLKNANI